MIGVIRYSEFHCSFNLTSYLDCFEADLDLRVGVGDTDFLLGVTDLLADLKFAFFR